VSADYLLGQGAAEHARLDDQHRLWRHTLVPTLRAAGLGPGSSVLEVGCGVGSLLEDLVDIVGPTGRAAGIEKAPEAVKAARERLPAVTITEGDLRDVPLGGPWDAVVVRWVLSFLPDLDPIVARLADAVRPGGMLVVQDYHHKGLGTVPEDPAIRRAIQAVRAAYRSRGGDVFLAGKLPGMMRRAGLAVTAIEPHVLASGPDGGPFRWVRRFMLEHLDTMVADGHLTAAEADSIRAAWARMSEEPDTVLFTPMVVR
jgi:ubiquinone/menaquinone biosynthesis C-methylase UbiE